MTDKEILSCINTLPPNFKLIKNVSTDTLDYSISTDDDTLLVTLGGTVGSIWPPSKDWLIDFEFWKQQFKPGYVENGFLTEAKIIIADIENVCQMIIPKKMILSGFSKGGAHSAIIHDYFRSRFEVYTVNAGSPRAFSDITKDFSDSFKTNFKRYHFITDLVPHLPFSILGFRHIGKSLNIGWFNPFKAHNLDNYIKRIK